MILSISSDTFQTMGSWNIQVGKEKKKICKFKAAPDRVKHVQQNSWTTIQTDNATIIRKFLYIELNNWERN